MVNYTARLLPRFLRYKPLIYRIYYRRRDRKQQDRAAERPGGVVELLAPERQLHRPPDAEIGVGVVDRRRRILLVIHKGLPYAIRTERLPELKGRSFRIS